MKCITNSYLFCFAYRFAEMQVQLQGKKRLRAEVQESCEVILKKKEKAEKLVSFTLLFDRLLLFF